MQSRNNLGRPALKRRVENASVPKREENEGECAERGESAPKPEGESGTRWLSAGHGNERKAIGLKMSRDKQRVFKLVHRGADSLERSWDGRSRNRQEVQDMAQELPT